MKKLNKILILVVVLFVAIFLGSCAKKAAEPIILGVAGPHTGDLAPFGIHTLHAAQIISDKVNAAGGINGRMIKIDAVDDLCDPAQATTVASKLVEAKVVAVIGHVCSGATISAMPTYINAGIPAISPSATNPTLTFSGDYPGFFRTIAPDNLQGVTQADFLVNKLNVKTVAIIHDQADYGKGLVDSTKAALEKSGVTIAYYDGVTPGAVDYSSVVSKIINAKVDAVVFGGYHPEGSKLITQLKEKNFKGAFISGDGMKSDDLISLAGAASEGVYATGAKDYSNNAIYKQAHQEHLDKMGGEPGTFYYEGYSAVLVVIDALKAGNVTPETIKKYLMSGKSFDTAVGTITFDSKGDAQGTGFDVYQVRNGSFQAVQ